MLNQVFKRIAMVGMGLLLFGIFAYVAGARFNTTKSMPIGLYWASNAPIEKGAYVLFCPPKSKVFDEAKKRGYIAAGLCPGNTRFMMKRVLALHNDVVIITDQGVRINGQMLPHSVPLKFDQAKRPLPRYSRYSSPFTLGPTELLLMSGSSTSFDSRYFGPINRAQIKTVVRPLITW